MEPLGAWIDQERARLSDEAYFAGGGSADQNMVAAFAELVRPLEERTGTALKGPNRLICFRAFQSSPERFQAMCSEAMRPTSRNPVAVLVKMVKDGDHLWNPEAGEAGAAA